MTDEDDKTTIVSEPTEDDDGDAEEQAIATETKELMRTGPGGHNRSGGLAFLCIAVLVIAGLHFHFAGGGNDAFLTRLDTELLTHAELTLAAMEDGGKLTVVPSWPLRLYETLRNDIMLYAAAAVLASLLWGLSARARARRDAWLVHEKLNREVEELRRRLDRLDPAGATRKNEDDTKG